MDDIGDIVWMSKVTLYGWNSYDRKDDIGDIKWMT